MLVDETEDSVQSFEGSETGDEPTREERMTELLEVLKEVVSESLKGNKLIHGPDKPEKRYPFLMQGAINEKAFIATGAHKFKTLAKYLSTVKVTHKLFLDVVKYAGEEDKLDIRCWLELALFCNLCPQAENSSYYIDMALDRLVPAVAALHDGIYEETYTKEKMKEDLSNKVTLYDKQEVIQKARELFGLLEGSESLCAVLYEEEEKKEEEAAANATGEDPNVSKPMGFDAFRLTFHDAPEKPVVTDQQQGLEKEAPPPPVRGGDRASGSSGAGPFDSQELAKRVQDHFRTNFCDSDFPKATTSAHGTRREDIVGTVSMKLYAKGGQTPSSCDSGNGSTSGDSDANKVKQTGQGVLLKKYLRMQNEQLQTKTLQKTQSNLNPLRSQAPRVIQMLRKS